MKSHCDIWELRNQWVAQSSGLLIVDPAPTIYAMASYARESGAKLGAGESVSGAACAAHAALPLVSPLLTRSALEWLIITCSKVCIYVFPLSFLLIPTCTFPLEGWAKKEKLCIFWSTFQCMKERMKESKTLISLKWGPLIIGPRRCLSRQPFPGTLLEMSTTGNWIHLAVGVQPPLTAFKRRGNICHLSISPVWASECIAVTSRYRLSDAVWALWQSSGLLKSESEQVGGDGGGWCLRKAFFYLWVFKVVKVARDVLFLIIWLHLALQEGWGSGWSSSHSARQRCSKGSEHVSNNETRLKTRLRTGISRICFRSFVYSQFSCAVCASF